MSKPKPKPSAIWYCPACGGYSKLYGPLVLAPLEPIKVTCPTCAKRMEIVPSFYPMEAEP